jgi:TonB family protein
MRIHILRAPGTLAALLVCATIQAGQAGAQESGAQLRAAADSSAARVAPSIEEILPGDPTATAPVLLNAGEMSRAFARSYPPLLRDQQVSGEVVIRARVLESGRVDSASVEVVQATHPEFGEVAARVIRSAVFRPARANGQPVAFTLLYPIQFAVEPPSASPGAPGTRRPER